MVGHERFMDQVIVSDPLLRDAARFAAHPNFPMAVKSYCTALAKFREAPRLVNVIVSTDVRWRIVGYLLYLHADRERFGPHGGATYGRLLEMSMRRGEASPRTVKTLLALLKFSGLVRVYTSPTDRRSKYYQPTDRLTEFVRTWLSYGTAALDLIEPEMERGRLLDCPDFRNRFQVSGGRAHLTDPIPLADRVPKPMSSLQSMLGSYSVIVGVMEADLQSMPTPTAFSMASRFGLSKSQVANVIAAGQREGLFALDPAGKLVPTDALRGSFTRWISIELAFYARHMRPPSEAI